MTTSTISTRPTKSSVRELFLLSSILLLGSCSSIRTTSDPDFRIHRGDTYAWVDSALHDVTGGDDLPWTDFQKAIDRELARRSIRQTNPREAKFIVRPRLAVKVVEDDLYDPDFDLWSKEKYEEGSLYIELLAGDERNPVWTGECRHRLRYVAQTMSGNPMERWVPTDDERRWRVEEVVARIFQRMPLEDALVDSGSPTAGAGETPREPRP